MDSSPSEQRLVSVISYQFITLLKLEFCPPALFGEDGGSKELGMASILLQLPSKKDDCRCERSHLDDMDDVELLLQMKRNIGVNTTIGSADVKRTGCHI